MIPEKALSIVSHRGAEPQRKTNLDYETWNLEFQPKVGVIARSIELGENDMAIPGYIVVRGQVPSSGSCPAGCTGACGTDGCHKIHRGWFRCDFAPVSRGAGSAAARSPDTGSTHHKGVAGSGDGSWRGRYISGRWAGHQHSGASGALESVRAKTVFLYLGLCLTGAVATGLVLRLVT